MKQKEKKEKRRSEKLIDMMYISVCMRGKGEENVGSGENEKRIDRYVMDQKTGVKFRRFSPKCKRFCCQGKPKDGRLGVLPEGRGEDEGGV